MASPATNDSAKSPTFTPPAPSSLAGQPSRSASFRTQYQALKQPTASPAIISISVHEYRPSPRRSSETPRAMPSSVGTATDQPTMPNTPRPRAKPRSLWARARSLRPSFSATVSTSSSCGRGVTGAGSSGRRGPFGMSAPQLRHVLQDLALQLDQGAAHALLLLAALREPLAHHGLGVAQRARHHRALARG